MASPRRASRRSSPLAGLRPADFHLERRYPNQRQHEPLTRDLRADHAPLHNDRVSWIIFIGNRQAPECESQEDAALGILFGVAFVKQNVASPRYARDLKRLSEMRADLPLAQVLARRDTGDLRFVPEPVVFSSPEQIGRAH